MAVPTEQKKREDRREAKAEIAAVLDRAGYLDSLSQINQACKFQVCQGSSS